MSSARGTEADLGYQQALRYAEEIRALYQQEQARADELQTAKEDVERKQAELEVLHAIDLSILGVVPMEDTLGVVEAGLSTLLGVDRMSLLLYDTERDLIRPFFVPPAPPSDPVPEGPPEGVVREAIELRTPVTTLLSKDSSPGVRHLFDVGLRSAILLPLVADQRIRGVLTMASFHPELPSVSAVQTGKRIATQVAVALRARELSELDRRRTAELEAVRVVSESVGASLKLGEVLEAAMDRTTELTGLQTAAVRLVDEGSRELMLTASRNLPEVLRGLERLPLDAPLAQLILGDGTPHLVRDAFSDERLSVRGELERAGYKAASTVHAPMHWEGRTIGVITLASFEGRVVTEADLSLLTAISRPIAAAIGNARLYENLRQMDATRRRLLARLVSAQEEERQGIANDIHDDSIQVMSAVGMRLYSLRKRLTDPEHLATLDEFAKTITEATRRLRSLMFELRPPALDREGLGPALRMYLEQNANGEGPSYELEDHLVSEPTPEIRAVVYRIVQEALTNIRKHARATRVQVLLEPMGVGVRVRVTDDGVGLPAGQSDRSAPGHMGFTAMRERAEMAAGWWRIDSTPGEGTVVEFWVPSEPEEADPSGESASPAA